MAPASIARHIVSLKVFFRYLQLEGVLHENLAELLGSQKLWERVPKVLSPEQVDRLLRQPRGRTTRSGGATGPCWNCSTRPAAGPRRSRNLQLCDVHLDEGFCICRGKGDKERLVPLGGRAAAAVQAYLEHERPAAGGPARRAGRLGSCYRIAAGGCGGSGSGNC